ncbi:hypothetical protein [Microbacterium imperiale]|nr:hypothetical protein [Microbacterium imperiale]MBP2419984.1 hypothetical protein [Microbacterium imperiale]MDS0198152.1 hypothetical protein [Microbacterium imperiale]
MDSDESWASRARGVSPVWFPIGIMVGLGGIIWSLLDFSLFSVLTIGAGAMWMTWAAIGSRLRGDT